MGAKAPMWGRRRAPAAPAVLEWWLLLLGCGLPEIRNPRSRGSACGLRCIESFKRKTGVSHTFLERGAAACRPCAWRQLGRGPRRLVRAQPLRRTPRPPPALSINKMAINKMAH